MNNGNENGDGLIIISTIILIILLVISICVKLNIYSKLFSITNNYDSINSVTPPKYEEINLLTESPPNYNSLITISESQSRSQSELLLLD